MFRDPRSGGCVYCQRDGRDGHFNPPQSGTASPLLAGVGPGLQPVPRGLLMEVLGLAPGGGQGLMDWEVLFGWGVIQ